MKLLINYANEIFRESQYLNSASGLQVGTFDNAISYSPKDIDSDFSERNKGILRQKRGNGYWLWKPYFIKKSLEALKFGDFLFYCDSGSYFIESINPLIKVSLESGQDLIIFDLIHTEKVWTKRDAFILMDCDDPKFTESKQRLSGFILWKKSKFTMGFINEYLQFTQDERIITDMNNQCGKPNYPGFKEHRHDQSILSLLTKKYGLEAYRDPSQWGNELIEFYPNSPYGQLIELTRKRNTIVSQNHR